MKEEARKTGINAIDTVPWGTHLCQFYDTKQDLLDILVPYFKVGLENNEFCSWVTSEPLSDKEAKAPLRKAIPNFAQYLRKGQIEIVPDTEWYLKDGAFNQQRVLNAWVDKLDQALAKGYDGMRVTGNVTWVEAEDWRNFIDYEAEVNKVIGKYRIIVICSYPLSEYGANEVIDVVCKHQLVLIRQAGEWVLLKSGDPPKMIRRDASSTSRIQRRLTRLQERFIKSRFEGLDDREAIELLLCLALPARQCKQLAKKCVERFKHLRGFLTASPQELEQVGVSPRCMFFIELLRELPTEVLKQKIIERSVYESSKEIFDYLYFSMRDLKKEVFKVIYLNSQSQIIDTADLFEGTVESTPVHPREIIEAAIKHNAVSLIFVHNHPSGDPTPSKSDKQLTRDLVFVGNVTQIKVLDHIVIGENRYFSFADDGLIKKYEDDFLNIRIRMLHQDRQH